MRGNRKREFRQEQLKIFAILASGAVLTGNAFLEARGSGPLTGLILSPIQSFVSWATPATPWLVDNPERDAQTTK